MRTQDTPSMPVRVQIVSDTSDITRQLIALGITAVAAIGVIWLQRKFSGPDAFTQLQMRAMVTVQNYADERVKYWQGVSDRAGRVYLSSRAVV